MTPNFLFTMGAAVGVPIGALVMWAIERLRSWIRSRNRRARLERLIGCSLDDVKRRCDKELVAPPMLDAESLRELFDE